MIEGLVGYKPDLRREPGWRQDLPCGHSIRVASGQGQAAFQAAVDEHLKDCVVCKSYQTKKAPNRGPTGQKGAR